MNSGELVSHNHDDDDQFFFPEPNFTSLLLIQLIILYTFWCLDVTKEIQTLCFWLRCSGCMCQHVGHRWQQVPCPSGYDAKGGRLYTSFTDAKQKAECIGCRPDLVSKTNLLCHSRRKVEQHLATSPQEFSLYNTFLYI